jgi:uncharacterized protein (DUF2147 family)
MDMTGTALIALAMATGSLSPNMAVGHWKTETRNGIVDIQRCGASICGKLITSDGIAANPATADTNNKDPALRGRLLKGLQILGGFTVDGDHWSGGSIYKADDGKTYDATVTIVDAGTLKVRGCIFVPFCKTQLWRRVP